MSLALPLAFKHRQMVDVIPPLGQLAQFVRHRGLSDRATKVVHALFGGSGDYMYRQQFVKARKQAAVAEENVAATNFASYHLDNFSHTYFANRMRKRRRVAHERTDANWTAFGRTFTSVDIATLKYSPAQRLWPASGDFIRTPSGDAVVAALIDKCYIMGWSDKYTLSASRAAKDYGHPVGTKSRPASAKQRHIFGSKYRPVELLSANISSNAGLMSTVHYAVDHMDPTYYQVLRVDINIWYRMMKAMATPLFQKFAIIYPNVSFMLAPWHSLKMFAIQIWQSLCPGAHPFVGADKRHTHNYA